MSWWHWQDEEPNAFECGRLAGDGWAVNNCSEQIRYLCQKGKSLKTCMKSHSHLHRYIYKSIATFLLKHDF